MNIITGVGSSDGPLVDLLIGLAASDVQLLRQAGRPVPAAIAVRALLDTGADVTCADSGTLAPLVAAGLAVGRLFLSNVPALGGLVGTREFAAGLTIVHPSGDPKANLVLRNHPVVEFALGTLGYQALIGRDILDNCLLVYSGKSFTLGY